MMFNKYFRLAFFWHIVQMYFPNTFEFSYLNRAWVMSLYADILLGEVISENRKEETGKNKISKQKGGKVNPWWIIELLFQWKFEVNLGKNSWEIMQIQTWYWLRGKNRVILIPYWSKIDPKIDPGDITLFQAWVFAFSWMTSWALLQIHFNGWEKKLHGKKNTQHATKPWYYKAVRIHLFQYSKSQSQMEGWAVLRWGINDVQHFNCGQMSFPRK